MDSFYTPDELKKLGFKTFGQEVYISKKASFYSPEKITLGNHVRIDDFCILSGKITIGNYVHISAFNALYGKAGIKIGNFCGISPRCTLFSVSDDFSGQAMVSPMVPAHLTKLSEGPITLCDFAQIGAHSVVMPGCTLAEGAVCGAFSFVNKNLPPWTVSIGVPCRLLKKRLQNPKNLAASI